MSDHEFDAVVTTHPNRAGGQPMFVNGSAPVEAVLSRFRAGDSIAGLARDFEVPAADIEEALRRCVAGADRRRRERISAGMGMGEG